MGYFPNGTAGELYEARWCGFCVHQGDDNRGCPVWNAHLFFSYDLCNKPKDPGKQILEMLIPSDKKGYPEECTMFRDRRTPEEISADARRFTCGHRRLTFGCSMCSQSVKPAETE